MILYFSGTGNSLAVAKHLAEHLGEQIMPLQMAADVDLSQEKRIGCGICAKVCPVGNISMKDGKAVNGVNCNYCLGCVHFCPHQAMEINGKPTPKERQYHHPKVSLKDMVM